MLLHQPETVDCKPCEFRGTPERAILSQAAERRKVQRLSREGVGSSDPKRTAPFVGDDIVWTSWEHGAALWGGIEGSDLDANTTKEFLISGTELAVNKAGRASELGYQAAKAARELKRDCESILLDNTAAVAGNDTTARKTGGLVAWLKTNVNSSDTNSVDPVWTSAPTGARSDGVQRAYTETILQDVVKKVWDAGGDPSILMVGSFNKQAVSAFAGIAAQRFMAPAGPSTIVGAADIYVSDFGSLSVVPNRFQRARDGLVIDPSRARMRTLRPYEIHEMARTGDSEKRLMLVEYGLQVDNEAAHGIAADLNTS